MQQYDRLYLVSFVVYIAVDVSLYAVDRVSYLHIEAIWHARYAWHGYSVLSFPLLGSRDGVYPRLC